MKHLRLIAVASCCIGTATLVIWLTSPSPNVGSSGDHCTSCPAHIATQKSEQVVDPTYELGDIVESVQNELIQKGERLVMYSETEQRWREYRRNGGTSWGSENWMKAPEYYRKLDTPALALECYDEESVFPFEVSIYNDPQFGFIHMKVMHDGFAELFQRPDMWKGLLAVYREKASKLNPDADLDTIVSASMTLDSLRVLYTMPEFKPQFKGREKEFLQAHVEVLKKYRDYIDKFDPEKVGSPTPFFGEAGSVGRVALLLLEQVDPSAYARVEPIVRRLKWPEKQDMKDIRNFLEIVIPAADIP